MLIESYGSTRIVNTDFLNLLIKIGTPLDERDSYGRTPLHVAAMHNYVEAATMLLNTKQGLELINAK